MHLVRHLSQPLTAVILSVHTYFVSVCSVLSISSNLLQYLSLHSLFVFVSHLFSYIYTSHTQPFTDPGNAILPYLVKQNQLIIGCSVTHRDKVRRKRCPKAAGQYTWWISQIKRWVVTIWRAACTVHSLNMTRLYSHIQPADNLLSHNQGHPL